MTSRTLASKNKEITIFLGAGISKPLGMPLVQDVNNLLFEESYTHFVEDNEDKFIRLPKGKATTSSASDETMTGVQNLLQGLFYYDEHYLKSIAPFKYKNGVKYYGSAYRKSSNYEVLYYLCEQILLTNQGLTDNPMIAAFMEKIANHKFDDFFGIEKILEIEKKGQLALKFIQWIVTTELNKKCDSELLSKELKLILEIIDSKLFERINIITFNHDILLEKLLINSNIDFCDGFEKNNAEVKHYVGFEKNTSGIHLIKPHGSINWFSTMKKGEITNVKLSENMVREYFGEIEYLDTSGNTVRFLKRHPDYLSGMGKVEKYNYNIYSDMAFEMHNILKTNKLMVMSGYGWGDPAINGRLSRWLDGSNKLILLHPNPHVLKSNSVYLDGNMENLEMSKKLICIKKWLCNTSLNDMKEYFD